ncbi:Sip1-related alpha-galactosidase [Bacteroidales bacterium]|nr:Sip1-related alpha-galactosidase [Bacteroidales bacterium]
MNKTPIYLLAIFLLLSSCEGGNKPNVVIKNTFTEAIPDIHGIIEKQQLEIRDFEEVVFYASHWWPGGGNRLYPFFGKNGDLSNGFTGGMMMVFKHRNHDYSCYLAGANSDIYSWFETEDGKSFYLNTGHLGKGSYSGTDRLQCFHTSGNSVYDVINKAWKAFRNAENSSVDFRLREEKVYPEPFKYLGWCSWESFKTNINEQKLVNAVDKIEESGIPIRFLLMDDGHQRIHLDDPWDYNGLLDFAPIAERFPNGYKPLLEKRNDDKIKWMGIWLSYLGGRDGIYPEHNLPQLESNLAMSNMNALIPKGGLEDAKKFYHHYLDITTVQPGWDFTKIDFQSRALTHYASGEAANYPIKSNAGAFSNAYMAASNLTKALEANMEEHNMGLINCNANSMFVLSNAKYSNVTRCSEDYKVYNIGRARNHLYYSYASMPLLGQVFWGDHDMFHSSDTVSGEMMAISKAMSGGPVYLSDKPGHFDAELISPLCYTNGELLRPLAPAVPTEECVFMDNQFEKEALITFAPLANKSVAIAAYNLYADLRISEEVMAYLKSKNMDDASLQILKGFKDKRFKNYDEIKVFALKESGLAKNHAWQLIKAVNELAKEAPVSGQLTTNIYKNASAMMQPYKGEWEIPNEGLMCYNWKSGEIVDLKNEVTFSIDEFNDMLFHIVPKQNGWAIVGDVSKYLSPAGYELKASTNEELTLGLKEGGIIRLWKKCDHLSSNVGTVTKVDKNFWQIEVDKSVKEIIVNAKHKN